MKITSSALCHKSERQTVVTASWNQPRRRCHSNCKVLSLNVQENQCRNKMNIALILHENVSCLCFMRRFPVLLQSRSVGKNWVVHGLLIPSLFWPPTYLSPSFTRPLRRLYIFRTVPAALLRSSSFDLPSLSFSANSKPSRFPRAAAPLAPCQRSARTDVLNTAPSHTRLVNWRSIVFIFPSSIYGKLLHSNTEVICVLGIPN